MMQFLYEFSEMASVRKDSESCRAFTMSVCEVSHESDADVTTCTDPSAGAHDESLQSNLYREYGRSPEWECDSRMLNDRII